MKKFAILIGVLAILGWVGQAMAQPSVDSDRLVVYSGDRVVAVGAAAEVDDELGSTTPVAAERISVDVPDYTPFLNQSLFGKYYLVLEGPTSSVISDVVGIADMNGNIGSTDPNAVHDWKLAFQSDDEGEFTLAAGFWDPTNGIVDVLDEAPGKIFAEELNRFFIQTTGSFHATFFSDSDRVVPVPGAMLLGALGLGMVGWVRRRLA